MQIAPITKDALHRLVAATLAPVVPLALTMMPLEELLKKLLGILFEENSKSENTDAITLGG